MYSTYDVERAMIDPCGKKFDQPMQTDMVGSTGKPPETGHAQTLAALGDIFSL